MLLTTLISITASLSLIYLALSYYNRKLARQNHQIMMQIERNKQVYLFRSRLLLEFGSDITEVMPDYDEMLASDKPLVANEWVRVDELVNLN